MCAKAKQDSGTSWCHDNAWAYITNHRRWIVNMFCLMLCTISVYCILNTSFFLQSCFLQIKGKNNMIMIYFCQLHNIFCLCLPRQSQITVGKLLSVGRKWQASTLEHQIHSDGIPGSQCERLLSARCTALKPHIFMLFLIE